MSGVTVLNNTTGNTLETDTYEVVVENLSPILKITDGSYISVGDSLKITSLEGNVLYINGEQIKFTTIDFANNSVVDYNEEQMVQEYKNTLVSLQKCLVLLSNNRLSDLYIDQTWNSYTFNTTKETHYRSPILLQHSFYKRI